MAGGNLDLFIFAGIAIGLVFMLFRVLGTRTGNEETDDIKRQKESLKQQTQSPQPPLTPSRLEEDSHFTTLPLNVQTSIQEIKDKNPDFNVSTFLENSKKAYEIILESFFSGKKQTLKRLLEPAVYDGFSKAIDLRYDNSETLEAQLIGIDDTHITKAVLENNKAKITITFNSQQSSVTHAQDGSVIRGQENYVAPVQDVWTFSKDITSSSPNWFLSATGTT